MKLVSKSNKFDLEQKVYNFFNIVPSLSLYAFHDLQSIDLTTLHAQLKYVEYVTAAQPIQFDIQSSHRASD